ncbi:histidinol-phosphatase LALA0_S03e10396g [Lachancea lanzarotensis]|uniref:Histidinol-phosphatase n=1 Tax=Lachancea lanzarotensis TaxID=1245769 RepID=A0A0C7N8K2_9SACH|nr:uncharacterized protein LALA0_S03e10396g [Lachancea lanzarotensis]CEP61762.1 LALA0S03e10396g1_1 [Lachancea lanzarotensis]
MYSHHSHSLDYVAHGVDCLEDVVARANEMKMELFCLTEHMPRIDAKYLYPEETSDSAEDDLKTLQGKFDKFLEHASEVKARNLPTKIIIGVEVEGCDTNHIAYAKGLMEKNANVLQFCVGSQHHINGIPIDFDQGEWNRALAYSHNNLRLLARDYFEQQYKLICELKPLVLGHFDLFRLFCSKDIFFDSENGQLVSKSAPNAVSAASVSFTKKWDDIRLLAERNIRTVASYGGLMEINTSGLRKKLEDPYPGREFALLAKNIPGTRFVLSDDAHGVSHVGVCYDQALKYMDEILQLDELHFLVDNAGTLEVDSIKLADLKSSPFWQQYG